MTAWVKILIKNFFVFKKFTCMGWLRQSQFSCNTCNTSGDRTSAIVGKCPDWNGLSVKLGGLLLFPEPEPEPEPELQPDEPEDVVAILLPLSLALLLRPPSIDWFKLPIKGFLKGLEGLVSVKKICMFRKENFDYHIWYKNIRLDLVKMQEHEFQNTTSIAIWYNSVIVHKLKYH